MYYANAKWMRQDFEVIHELKQPSRDILIEKMQIEELYCKLQDTKAVKKIFESVNQFDEDENSTTNWTLILQSEMFIKFIIASDFYEELNNMIAGKKDNAMFLYRLPALLTNYKNYFEYKWYDILK